jgi:hypothetical protein
MAVLTRRRCWPAWERRCPFGIVRSSEVLSRLAAYPVLHTDERDNIEVITDGQRLWVKTQQ